MRDFFLHTTLSDSANEFFSLSVASSIDTISLFYIKWCNIIIWRRKWQPTPVFLPGESQGWGSLVGCHLWGHIESDTTEVT